ncbi:hypothetical protein [Mesorhizobium sp. B2-8-9]|uniref:hypothetical protein n=1 Tax=Mesorhizobium sp. B2-8-9 TaxID=2589899 RepID=UPI001125B3C0|nr:hypothetical protein [Mesorhizobium sp. B2-8-9]TPI86391.1 hypothetical protein FJ423_00785 [Mesorhizobium sp. B2-8-9]
MSGFKTCREWPACACGRGGPDFCKTPAKSEGLELTEAQVLLAVKQACAPRSAYIGDVLYRRYADAVRNGAAGYLPTRARILRRLRSLEKSGLIACVGGPDGFYGYEWRITKAGHLALAEIAP